MLLEEEMPSVAASDRSGPNARWKDLWAAEYRVPTATLTLGTVLFAFNTFFVSTAMPSAVKEFGETWLLSWSFTLYLVLAIIGGAFAANLKKRFGGRATLVGATCVFAVGTVAASLAGAPTLVAFGRLLQGAGEGVTIAVCYALIPELYPSRLVAKVFGMEAVAWAIAAFSGPLLAGALTEYLSWRMAFAASLPPAVLFVALVFALDAAEVEPNGQPQPIPALRLGVLGLGILMISAPGLAGHVALVAVALLAAVILILIVVAMDRRDQHPILPIHAFSLSHLPGPGLWIVLLMPVAGAAGAVFMVYALQVVWRLGPAEAGISNAVLAMSWSLVAIGVASLKSQALRLRLVPVGTLLLAVGLVVVLFAIKTNQFWLVYPAQFIIGAAFGACWGTVSQTLIDAAPDGERDKTSVLLPTLQSAGYAIGGAIFGLVADIGGLRSGMGPDAVREVLIPVFGAALVVAVVAIAFGIRMARVATLDSGQTA